MRLTYTRTYLRRLRNEVPIGDLIADVLKLPTKISEDYLRFLCPLCGEFHTAVNPSTNLGRCFRCAKNFNPIDMVMIVKGLSFLDAVAFLEPLL
jgi:DNA primase